MVRSLGKILLLVTPILFVSLSILSYVISYDDYNNVAPYWFGEAFYSGHYFHGINNFQIHNPTIQKAVLYFVIGAPILGLVIYNFWNVVRCVLFIFPMLFFLLYDLISGNIVSLLSEEPLLLAYLIGAPILGLLLYLSIHLSRKSFFNVENKTFYTGHNKLNFCIYGKEGERKLRIFLRGLKYEFSPKDIEKVEKVVPANKSNSLFSLNRLDERGYSRRNVIAELIAYLLIFIVWTVGSLVKLIYNVKNNKSGNCIILSNKHRTKIFIPTVVYSSWYMDRNRNDEYAVLVEFMEGK